MLSMVDKLSSFLNWLQSEMNEKNLTPADIARTGFVTSSAVSLLFSMKTKSVSYDMCRAISTATDVPLEIIYRKAGLLPQKADLDELREQILLDTADMTPDEQREILAYIRMKKDLRSEKEEKKASTDKLKPSTNTGK